MSLFDRRNLTQDLDVASCGRVEVAELLGLILNPRAVGVAADEDEVGEAAGPNATLLLLLSRIGSGDCLAADLGRHPWSLMSGRPPKETSFFVCSATSPLCLSRDFARARGPEPDALHVYPDQPSKVEPDATRNIADRAACSAAFRGATYPDALNASDRMFPPFKKTCRTFHLSEFSPHTTCASSFYSISALQCRSHLRWCCSVAKNNGSRITSALLGEVDFIQIL